MNEGGNPLHIVLMNDLPSTIWGDHVTALRLSVLQILLIGSSSLLIDA
jgi:hypothetical protein